MTAPTSSTGERRIDDAAGRRDARAARHSDEHVRDDHGERAHGDDVTIGATHPRTGPVGAGEEHVDMQRHDADGEEEAGDRQIEEQHIGRCHVAAMTEEHSTHDRVGADDQRHRGAEQRHLDRQLPLAQRSHPVVHCGVRVILHGRRRVPVEDRQWF